MIFWKTGAGWGMSGQRRVVCDFKLTHKNQAHVSRCYFEFWDNQTFLRNEKTLFGSISTNQASLQDAFFVPSSLSDVWSVEKITSYKRVLSERQVKSTTIAPYQILWVNLNLRQTLLGRRRP